VSKNQEEFLLLHSKKAHIVLADKCVLFSTKSAVGGRNLPAGDVFYIDFKEIRSWSDLYFRNLKTH
jgi:hypothetical protein